MPGLERWWRDGDAVARFVGDLVAHELSRLRPGAALPPRPWPADQSLTDGNLACDSLELLNLATALAEALEMHRSGLEDYLLARRTLADWGEAAGASLERFSSEIAFRTSGSTGAPKTVKHALADLIQEVEAHAQLLDGRRRVLSAVPAHHIYGFLWTVLLPQALGAEAVDVRGRSPAGVGAMVREGDLIIGHPTFWSAFVRAAGRPPPGAMGVTSTAPCPPETARAALACGLSGFIEIYGSSETAGVGWRSDPDTPFRLLPYWRPGETPLTIHRLAADGSVRQAEVPDRLAWVADRCFQLEGRTDDAVQVAGHNVFPAAVRARLLQHPLVRDAAVRLMRPSEGERLKAFIVPTEAAVDAAGLARELIAWCNALSAPERPKAFNFGAELPRNPLGKLADWPASDNAA